MPQFSRLESVVSPARLHELFWLSDDMGKLIYKPVPVTGRGSVCFNNNYANKIVNRSLNNSGYMQVRVLSDDGTERFVALVHRVIWAMATGSWPPGVLDHINGDRTDNRFSNLRLADVQTNCRNRLHQKTSTLSYKGVTRTKDRKSFAAQICAPGVKRWIGTFPTAEEAAIAYDNAATAHFGEFAKTNKSLGLL